jgi:C4-dicarboxylate-specific signal transduction histidine kinase
MRWSMRPWRAAGQLSGVIISCEDVTRSTQDRVVHERESRLSALGMMAGGIAHEIRTPLQTLMIHATLIREALDADAHALDRAFVRECADALVETTHRIDRTLKALQILSRQSPADPLVEVDVCEVIDSLAALCGDRFRAENVELRVSGCERSSGRVAGRSADIGQVLLNLLNNAFDAVAGCAERWVEIALIERPGEQVVRIRDSGPGIPAELRERVMTPFFTTKPVGKGSGLGLSLAKSLAQGMGARLVYDMLAPHTSFELSFTVAG